MKKLIILIIFLLALFVPNNAYALDKLNIDVDIDIKYDEYSYSTDVTETYTIEGMDNSTNLCFYVLDKRNLDTNFEYTKTNNCISTGINKDNKYVIKYTDVVYNDLLYLYIHPAINSNLSTNYRTFKFNLHTNKTLEGHIISYNRDDFEVVEERNNISGFYIKDTYYPSLEIKSIKKEDNDPYIPIDNPVDDNGEKSIILNLLFMFGVPFLISILLLVINYIIIKKYKSKGILNNRDYLNATLIKLMIICTIGFNVPVLFLSMGNIFYILPNIIFNIIMLVVCYFIIKNSHKIQKDTLSGMYFALLIFGGLINLFAFIINGYNLSMIDKFYQEYL